jgi:hypothetical protein
LRLGSKEESEFCSYCEFEATRCPSALFGLADKDGYIRHVCRKFKELTGWEPEELVGKPAFTVMTDQQRWTAVPRIKNRILAETEEVPDPITRMMIKTKYDSKDEPLKINYEFHNSVIEYGGERLQASSGEALPVYLYRNSETFCRAYDQWLKSQKGLDTHTRRRFFITDFDIVYVSDGNNIEGGDMKSEVDVEIFIEARALIEFWRGNLDLLEAVKRGKVRTDNLAELQKTIELAKSYKPGIGHIDQFLKEWGYTTRFLQGTYIFQDGETFAQFYHEWTQYWSKLWVKFKGGIPDKKWPVTISRRFVIEDLGIAFVHRFTDEGELEIQIGDTESSVDIELQIKQAEDLIYFWRGEVSLQDLTDSGRFIPRGDPEIVSTWYRQSNDSMVFGYYIDEFMLRNHYTAINPKADPIYIYRDKKTFIRMFEKWMYHVMCVSFDIARSVDFSVKLNLSEPDIVLWFRIERGLIESGGWPLDYRIHKTDLEADIEITETCRTLMNYWRGTRTTEEAIESGDVHIHDKLEFMPVMQRLAKPLLGTINLWLEQHGYTEQEPEDEPDEPDDEEESVAQFVNL